MFRQFAGLKCESAFCKCFSVCFEYSSRASSKVFSSATRESLVMIIISIAESICRSRGRFVLQRKLMSAQSRLLYIRIGCRLLERLLGGKNRAQHTYSKVDLSVALFANIFITLRTPRERNLRPARELRPERLDSLHE